MRQTPLSSACFGLIRSRVSFALTSLAAMAIASPAPASPAHIGGVWSNGHDLGTVPVHFVLSPGDSAGMLSTISWWRSMPEGPGIKYGGFLFQRAFREPPTGSLASAAFPESLFYDRPAEAGPTNDFCAGTVRLEDSGTMIVGGTESTDADVGTTQNEIMLDGSRTWLQPDAHLRMHDRRWYGTGTLLGDGRVFIHSGSRYVQALIFGGITDSLRNDGVTRALAPPLVQRLGFSSHGEWDTPASPYPVLTAGVTAPRPREGGNAMLSISADHTVYFGGCDPAVADPASRCSNELWWLYRSDDHPSEANSNDYDYTWLRKPLAGDPSLSASIDTPVGRYRASAALDMFDDLVVFGGLTSTAAGDSTLSDLWVGRGAHYGNSSENRWYRVHMENLPERGDADLGARCGAAMWTDPLFHEIYFFGGAASADATPSDAAVYHLSLLWHEPDGSAPGFYTAHWNVVPEVQGSAAGVARARAGLAVDPREYLSAPVPKSMRFVLQGGRTAQGVTSDLLALWIFRTETATLGVYWQPIAMPPSSSTPVAALDPALLYDRETTRLITLGGRTASGGISHDIRAALMPFYDDPRIAPTPTWVEYGSGGLPHGLSGACAAVPFSDSYSRFAEIFDPHAPANTNHFTRLDSDPHLAEWYPFDFAIPTLGGSGAHRYVFEAGPRVDSWMADLGTAAQDGARWKPVDASRDTSLIKGGSAVMYRVGHILKCGTRDSEHFHPATNRTVTMDLRGMATGAITPSDFASLRWHVESPMHAARVNHGLVLLPTGDVAVFNGITQTADNDADDTDFPFVYLPEVWHPGDEDGSTSHWSDMNSDPFLHRRGYHSSAFLLADARVMVGGGNTLHQSGAFDGRANIDSVQIYSPPYLFGADDRLLPRPVILGLSAADVAYGGVATLLTDVAIDDAVLMRPAATTHAFDAEQRFVPLTRLRSQATQSPFAFTFRVPADPDSLPPGDYMLFARRAAMAPSIARWIHVRRTATTGPARDPGDLVRPGRMALRLSGTECGGTMRLSWAAPADDSTLVASGAVTAIDIRYTDEGPIDTWARFRAAKPVPVELPAPGAPGETQQITFTLDTGRTYWFAAACNDDARTGPNFSALSPVLRRTMLGCESDLFASTGQDSAAGGGSAIQETGVLGAPEGTSVSAGSVSCASGASTAGGSRTIRLRVRLRLRPDATPLWLHADALPGETASDTLVIESLQHSREGTLAPALCARASEGVHLLGGDTLWLDLSAATTATQLRIEAQRQPFAPIAELATVLPARTAIEKISPNPTAESSRITFALAKPGVVRLEVFDITGRRIRTLASSTFAAGHHDVAWDGKDDRGARARAGIYRVRLSTAGTQDHRAIVLID